MSIEHKTFLGEPLEIKATGGKSGAGSVRGYAAVFNNVDLQGDQILPGAFKDSIEDFLQNGFIAWGHDAKGQPAAMPVKAWEDDYGLMLEADFHSTPMGQDARTIAQERRAAGKSVSFSIGYLPPQTGEYEYKNGVRLLKKINLRETSLVNIPANPKALVMDVKDGSLAGLSFADHTEAVLAAADGLVTRAKDISDLRQKAGRRISAANRAKLQSIRDLIDGLLAADARDTEADDDNEAASDVVAVMEGAKDEPVEAPKEPEAETKQQEPKKQRSADVKPGQAGTLEYYKRSLIDFEHFAIQRGIPLAVAPNNTNKE